MALAAFAPASDEGDDVADYEKGRGRGEQEVAARFCIVAQDSLTMLNERHPERTIAAQRKVDDEMLSALEGMVRAAREGGLEGAAALGQQALAW
jgi:hypothetical protein